MSLTAPVALAAQHDLTVFNPGVETLDTWLRRRAWKNQISGASRTFVVCEDVRVMGYYALASGAVAAEAASGRFKRNMPDPIPVVILGRLAVDQSLQGQQLGRALLGALWCKMRAGGYCKQRIRSASGACWCTRFPRAPRLSMSVRASTHRHWTP